MRNANDRDVERVQNGEFVPNVMFSVPSGNLVHMKEIALAGIFGGWKLEDGQKVFETSGGKLQIVHVNNLLPIKKHSFSSNASKKIKRKPVKGSRKYVKVSCDTGRAIALGKKQGWVTFEFEERKVKRYFNSDSYSWMNKYGVSVVAGGKEEDVYEYMYVPVEISSWHQATISTALSKSLNQFAEDAKLGEVMRKAGWKINDGQMPCHNRQPVRVILRNGVVPRAACIAEDWPWNYTGTGSDIIAYKIIE